MPGTRLRVWSLPVRLGHWALAACVLGCLVLHHGGPWHEGLGYAALAIALWRIGWGLFGSDAPARFGGFVRGPARTWSYASALLQRRAPRHLGHNPLGGWMIVALLAAALAAGASGALYVTDRFWGDPVVGALHEWSGWAFAVLAPVHLAGVALSSMLQRENLVRAMLTGWKEGRLDPQGLQDAQGSRGPNGRAQRRT